MPKIPQGSLSSVLLFTTPPILQFAHDIFDLENTHQKSPPIPFSALADIYEKWRIERSIRHIYKLPQGRVFTHVCKTILPQHFAIPVFTISSRQIACAAVALKTNPTFQPFLSNPPDFLREDGLGPPPELAGRRFLFPRGAEWSSAAKSDMLLLAKTMSSPLRTKRYKTMQNINNPHLTALDM